MEAPITISYRWTLDQVRRVNKLHARSGSSTNKALVLFRIAGIVCVVGGLLVMIRTGDLPSGLGPIVSGAVLLVIMPIIMWFSVRKAYKNKPDRDLLATYVATEEGLSYKTDIASSHVAWKALRRARRAKQGFLLYMTEAQLFWLPTDGFENAALADRFAALAKEKVTDYKDMK